MGTGTRPYEKSWAIVGKCSGSNPVGIHHMLKMIREFFKNLASLYHLFNEVDVYDIPQEEWDRRYNKKETK